jgi:hypothetical protein
MMTHEDIIKKAFELYPTKCYTDMGGFPEDENEEARNAYIKGCEDTLRANKGNSIKMLIAPLKDGHLSLSPEKQYYWSDLSGKFISAENDIVLEKADTPDIKIEWGDEPIEVEVLIEKK